MPHETELIIVGAGAAGLMAAAAGAEYGLRCLLIERKNQPGRKLLMCGNNRCNLTSDLPVAEMLEAYGARGEFVREAISQFPPGDLRQWFARHRVPTIVKENLRVYPRSGRANDVVNCFKDCLRDASTPIVLNCAVAGIQHGGSGYAVESPNATFSAPYVLVATGGVSYPKTGSVGDGQKFARTLGHKVTPYRPGLAAFGLAGSWWSRVRDLEIAQVALSIYVGDRLVATTRGGVEIRNGIAHGPAMIDASNVVSRENLRNYRFELDMAPDVVTFPGSAARALLKETLGGRAAGLLLAEQPDNMDPGEAIHHVAMPVTGPRPLKEAMVTVGGVATDEIEPNTMESKRSSGLYFAGEVMDVDGFCGGFNLQAAFATARLAVKSIADRLGRELRRPKSSQDRRRGKSRRRRN